MLTPTVQARFCSRPPNDTAVRLFLFHGVGTEDLWFNSFPLYNVTLKCSRDR